MINENEALDMTQMRQIREGVVKAKKDIDKEMARSNRPADIDPEKDALAGRFLAEATAIKESWRQASATEIAAMEKALVKFVPKAPAGRERSTFSKSMEAPKTKAGKKISAEEAWQRALNKQQVLALLKPLAEQGNRAAAAFIEAKTQELRLGKRKISAEEAWSRMDKVGKLDLIEKLLKRAKEGDRLAKEFILSKAREVKQLNKPKLQPAAEKPQQPLSYKELPPAKQAEIDQLMKLLRVKYHHDGRVGQDVDQSKRQELIKNLEDVKAKDVQRFLAQAKLLLGQKFDVRI